MSRRLIPACVLALAWGLVLLLPGAVRAADDDVVETMRASRLGRILADIDLDFSDYEDSPDELRVIVPYEGRDPGLIMILLNRETSLHLSGTFTESPLTYEDVNLWNKDHYFSRAFLKEEGTAVIEFDLDLTGGVTEKNIKEWILRFSKSLTAFLEFGVERLPDTDSSF